MHFDGRRDTRDALGFMPMFYRRAGRMPFVRNRWPLTLLFRPPTRVARAHYAVVKNMFRASHKKTPKPTWVSRKYRVEGEKEPAENGENEKAPAENGKTCA